MNGIEEVVQYIKGLVDNDQVREALTISLGDKKIDIKKMYNQDTITSFDIEEDVSLLELICTVSTRLANETNVEHIFCKLKNRKEPDFHLDHALRLTYVSPYDKGFMISFSSTTEEGRKWLDDYFRYRDHEQVSIDTEDYKTLDSFINEIDGVYPCIKTKQEDEQPGRAPH